MICPNCQKEVEKGAFCPFCGAPLPAENSDSAPENAAGATLDPSFYGENEAGETPLKKKKKIWPWIAGGIAALLAVFAVVVIVNRAYFGNVWRKTFYSPENYYQYVEKAFVEENLDRAAANPAPRQETVDFSKPVRLTASLDLAKEAAELLKGLPVDLTWLKNLGVSASVLPGKTDAKASFIFSLNGAKALEMDLFTSSDGTLLASLPAFSDKAIRLGAKEAVSALPLPFELPDLSGVKDALPDRESAAKIAKRYLDLVIEEFSSVEKTSEKMRAGEAEASFTVLTVSFDRETLEKALEKVAAALKEDGEVREIYEKIAAALGQTADYDGFLKSFEKGREEGEAPAIDLKMDVYVDAYGKVCGRKFYDEKGSFLFLKVQDGDRTGVLMRADGDESDTGDAFSVALEGAKNEKEGSAEYALSFQDDAMLTVRLEGWTDGKWGSLECKPTEKLLDLVAGNSLVSTLLKNFSLKLDLSEWEEMKGTLTALLGGNTVATVSIGAAEETEPLPDAPKAQESVEMDEWVQSLNANSLLSWAQALAKNAGIPLSLLMQVYRAVSGLLPAQS